METYLTSSLKNLYKFTSEYLYEVFKRLTKNELKLFEKENKVVKYLHNKFKFAKLTW